MTEQSFWLLVWALIATAGLVVVAYSYFELAFRHFDMMSEAVRAEDEACRAWHRKMVAVVRQYDPERADRMVMVGACIEVDALLTRAKRDA